jgi:putative transposase
MTNHIHLLASPGNQECVPKVMQSVGRRYVQYFNFHNNRTGTLWEGRYRATVVDAESYLFECMRYIELNPVRAGMVRHPRDHVWSSYRANAEDDEDALIRPHEMYGRLAKERQECKALYRALVEAPMNASVLGRIREHTNKGWALGSELFPSKIERLGERRAAPLPKGWPKSRTSE